MDSNLLKKVLIIEDDAFISDLYNIVFKKKGYDSEVAVDGEEGLVKAKNLLPDIILLDIMMPKKNGIEVLDELKNSESTKKIPVMVMSNLAEPTIMKNMIDKGAAKYIIKSQYLPDEIVKIAETILMETSKGN